MTDTTSLNLMHLMDRFQTDDKCRDYLGGTRTIQLTGIRVCDGDYGWATY